MDKALDALRHPNVWAVSVQLLILYCVSVGLFFSIDSVNRTLTGPLKDGAKAGKVPAILVLFAAAAVTNALGVWALEFLCQKTDTMPRLAMVILPLFLIGEKHARAARVHKEDRRPELLLALGMAAGMIAAAAALMRHAPLK